MKKIIKPLVLLSVLGGFLFLNACKKKDDPIPLVAKAGDDQSAAAFATVTLDGSTSTGPGQLNFEWQFNGGPVMETEINFLGKNDKVATFIPPKNGTYTFTLRVTQGNLFSSDDIAVTVTGIITLSGTLSSNLVLKDIESDPTKPDYKITADLIIPTGITVTKETTNATLIVEAADNTGIQIQGGSLTGAFVTLTSATGWKGILLSSGSLSLTTASRIINAGKSTFTGQTQAAAVTVTGGTVTINGGTVFTGTTGYDILITATSASSLIQSCTFSSTKPIKAPIANLSVISANNYGTYDFVTLTTPGAGTTLASSTGNFTFYPGTKFYIDGDFSAGSLLTMTGAPTIYVKAGAGILVSAGISAQGVTFDGFDGTNFGAPWKGIAIGGGSVSISSSFIKNAGSAVFNTGSVTSPQKAAIYFFASNNGTVTSTEISNSQGYGIYMEPGGNYLTLSGNSFKNSTLAQVSAPVGVISTILGGITTTTNTFTGVAAGVEVQSFSISSQPTSFWPALGTTYYQFLSSVTQQSGTWTLSPGVNVKFKSGKQLDITGGTFVAIGTVGSPITFDSDAGTAASWVGIGLESLYNLEFCTIKNGGQSEVLKGGAGAATEKANLVFNYAGISTANTFKNNTISGSGGYGTLIESGKQDPQPLLVANNNTFTSNTLGTSIKKP